MKRSMLIAVVGALLLTGAFQYGAGQSMHHGGMMGQGMMNENDTPTPVGPCMNMGMGMSGMGMMLQRQIVPVDDGIIVLLGNKLIKYDTKLNKKKEITLELDAVAMESMARQMGQLQSICHDMGMNVKTDDEEKQ